MPGESFCINARGLIVSHKHVLLQESILGICFSSKSSRYLGSDGTGKVVRVWDLQRRRFIKWLKGQTDTITGVMYNCRDEHLASISMKGDLIIHNLASGTRVAELKDPHNQVLRVMEYSQLSRHLLLTAVTAALSICGIPLHVVPSYPD